MTLVTGPQVSKKELALPHVCHEGTMDAGVVPSLPCPLLLWQSGELVEGSLERVSWFCALPPRAIRRVGPSPHLSSTTVLALMRGQVSQPHH